MEKIIIASKNPVKITATLEGFESIFLNVNFRIKGVDITSEVCEQPMTEKDTVKGALNRMNKAYKQYPKADYWVGIEGGLEEIGNEMINFAWVYISNNEKVAKARSASYFLPSKVSQLVRQGKELGEASDILCNTNDIKQKGGIVEVLTGGLITRASFYKEAVIMALIPFKNKILY